MKETFNQTNVTAMKHLVAATRKGMEQDRAKAQNKKAKPRRTLRHPFGGK